MLELQNFKQYVLDSIFSDLNTGGVYHPSLYISALVRDEFGNAAAKDEEQRYRKARIGVPALSMRDSERAEMEPKLRHQAQLAQAVMTALVYQRWVISFVTSKGPQMKFIDGPVTATGKSHPLLQSLSDLHIPFFMHQALVCVYEYPHFSMVEYHGQRVPNLGATLQLLFLRTNERPPFHFVDQFIEIGAEHNDKVETGLFGRNLLPGILAEHGPLADQKTLYYTADDMLDLLAGT